MHAMAYGCPVISHNNFSLQMPEFESIKEGKTGTFFNYNDIDDLVKKTILWLKFSENNRENIRQQCFLEVESYWTAEYQLQQLKKALNEK